jgi:hypothetical protein
LLISVGEGGAVKVEARVATDAPAPD